MKNLLLFSIEDLNDWIEPLGGHPQAYTPNLNRLASMGAVFTSAYAAAPACSPSRTAALFSRFPWETGIISNDRQWFDFFPYGQSKSVIGQIRQAGYETIGAGKIFHSRGGTSTLDLSDWSEFRYFDKVNYPRLSKSTKAGELSRKSDFGVDRTGQPSSDDLGTAWMIDRIQPGDSGKAWALGIFRPHLPFIVPQEFFDLIPERVSLPPGLGSNRFDPEDDRSHANLPKPAIRLATFQAKTGQILHRHGEYEFFLRAYLASIAYADSKLGLVLDRLEECGLMENTLIVLWSDHGWQLGEKLAFRKFTLWERALRLPLMMAGPGIHPGVVKNPVSLVDMAPTILAQLGLPAFDEFSGQDLSPVLEGSASLPRVYAPSVWGAGFKNDNLRLAYSIRTERYRYTLYWNGSAELYDHDQDPFEHDNLLESDDKDVRRRAKLVEAELRPYVDENMVDPATLPKRASVVGEELSDDEDD